MSRLLPVFVLQAILLLALSAALFLHGSAPLPVAAHLAFALGLMPLMLAAMLHFTAVLTRTGSPHWAVAPMPLLAWLGGLSMLLSFPPVSLGLGALHGGAGLAFTAAIVVLLFSLRRAIDCLGAPHPGLYWYQAALLCLALALATVFAMAALPRHFRELRLIHLHLNTLGFVGLTALGTLEVLVPTVLGRPDRQAPARLRQGVLPALAAVLLVAAGSVVAPWLAEIGAGLLLAIVLRGAWSWWRLGGAALFAPHSAVASLAMAVVGLVGLVLVGALHGRGLVPTFAVVPGFVAAFLLPLVTGAASHLLPAWWLPGAQGPWHAEFRRRLALLALPRAALFVLGGLCAAVGWEGGLWFTAAGLAVFALALASGLMAATVRHDGQGRPSR